MLIDRVDDYEILYRRVPNHPGNFKIENGLLRATSAAFGDRHRMQPSVNRAKLQCNNPENSRENPEDGVVCLVALEVRTHIPPQVIRTIHGVKQECEVDVKSDPVGEHCLVKDRSQHLANIAHALICALPMFTVSEKKVFEEKFRRALARLSKIAIEPNSQPELLGSIAILDNLANAIDLVT